ncbi:uncharacterized protein LOC125532659 [Triticum urartu]|uniref:uncharacterized protein LOC125532659 n=1 Tax=Triticum urartu TaxID=4572 RepID=UPI002043512C|nr:uncharacterized protein LOC125532659 [Triticum urartu]
MPNQQRHRAWDVEPRRTRLDTRPETHHGGTRDSPAPSAAFWLAGANSGAGADLAPAGPASGSLPVGPLDSVDHVDRGRPDASAPRLPLAHLPLPFPSSLALPSVLHLTERSRLRATPVTRPPASPRLLLVTRSSADDRYSLSDHELELGATSPTGSTPPSPSGRRRLPPLRLALLLLIHSPASMSRLMSEPRSQMPLPMPATTWRPPTTRSS